MTTKIIGTGSYLPPKKVTNDDLAKLVDTNDEWIVTRTGIRERRVAKEESFVDLAVKAGERAIENAGIQAEEIDLILVATMSSGYALPSISSVVQAKLKAINAIGIDLNVACSGFVFGLAAKRMRIFNQVFIALF